MSLDGLEDLEEKPNIIIDECVSSRMERYLAIRGYKSKNITRISGGTPDMDVIDIAKKKKAYIITRDRDFEGYSKALIVGVGTPVKEVYARLLKMIEGAS